MRKPSIGECVAATLVDVDEEGVLSQEPELDLIPRAVV